MLSASWRHDDEVSFDEFVAAYTQCGGSDHQRGFVVQLERDVRVQTLHSRSAFLQARWVELSEHFTNPADNATPLGIRLGREQTIEAPARVEGVRIRPEHIDPADGLVRGFDRLAPGDNRANGVRLWLAPETTALSDVDLWRRMLVQVPDVNRVRAVAVVLRGDMILAADANAGEQHRALDGDHIAPYVPARPSGNGTEGGDWVGVLRIRT